MAEFIYSLFYLIRPGRSRLCVPAALAGLALLAAMLTSAPALYGHAAAKGKVLGAPLKFDAPPVDLDGAGTSPPPEEETAPRRPAPVQTQQAQPQQAQQAQASSSDDDSGNGGAPKPIRLFGTVEFRSPIKNIPKWERVRNLESKRPTFGSNEADTMPKDVAARWDALRAKLQGAALMEKAKGINSFFNQWPYKTDMVVWGVEDYWEIPEEFLRKSGDCEDYAITKYYAMRNLGVPASSLRVVAIKDTIRNIGHAVLVVFVDENAYVLDNLTNLVLAHSRLTNYAPQFSVNEDFLWRHVKPQ